MVEEEQLQFLDSRVQYLDPVLKEILTKYGSDSVEIVSDVDIETITSLTDSAGKRRQFVEFLNSDGDLKIKRKNEDGNIEPLTISQNSERDDSILITSKGQLKNLSDDGNLEETLTKRVDRFG